MYMDDFSSTDDFHYTDEKKNVFPLYMEDLISTDDFHCIANILFFPLYEGLFEYR